MKSLEQVPLAWFEKEMLAHSKDFSPLICAAIGDEQLRMVVHSAIDRATIHGFICRGPIRLFIEMVLLCGSAFDTDPQYSKMGEVLRASGDQMQRAEQLHESSLDYLEKVSGPGAVNLHNALKELSIFAQMPIRFSSDDFVADMLEEMNNLFPEKVAYIGRGGLTALIEAGRAEAQKYGFSTVRGEALLILLMFTLGHGCTDDPLYPWIARTLRDERIIDQAVRAARLEKELLTWLGHVLASNEKGTQT
ncbi:hypothetical protein [Candidatus Thiosymbion oneisti]|uniref:hypothetical protein n=1 Tax=Candidatus Thiosymbion oneisti TaxID=589554 RepID=UPI00105D58E4|nr:hypothetical protein [Candidatus Thiosymbion oneisti]